MLTDMRLLSSILKRLPCAALLCFLLPAASVLAQQTQPTPNQPDEVLRITTELVQTDVMVFEKAGRFVDNLQQDQFELRVDGKPQPIAFFDRITAGSVTEEAQLAAARGVPRSDNEKNRASTGLPDRGRVVIFFVDDLHLSIDSVRRTKKTLLKFIDNEMGQNDQVAIASTSGQIGFLQQLTDNKAVLRAAVERLNLRPQQIADMERPPMSEYLAQAILVRRDQDVLNYFIEAVIKDGVPPLLAEGLVTSRAQQRLDQASIIARNTLFSLDSLTRTIAPMANRKLVFFISDGFLLNTSDTDTQSRFSSITNLAARNGIVIYSMDARGLVTDPNSDASQAAAFDPTGRVLTAQFGEITASQEGLRRLADNTGGRALLNSNSLDAGIVKTLKETSTYYIISWRPENEGQKNDKLRKIEVKVKGRSDVTVQYKKGYLPPSAKEQTAKASTTPVDAGKTSAPASKPKTPADELRAAVSSFYPLNTLPTQLAVDYVDTQQSGAMLSISMQIPSEALSFDPVEGKYKAEVDVGGSVYNDKGQTGANFGQRLSVSNDSLEPDYQRQHPVYFTSQVRLSPGLYQVRVAARDAKTGHAGSATQWVEIPDLKSNRLALSSLLVGETTLSALAQPAAAGEGAVAKAQLNVARSFARTSRLRFMTFIYNAGRGTTAAAPTTPTAATTPPTTTTTPMTGTKPPTPGTATPPTGTALPDVALQVQILRGGQPVMTTALRKVVTEGVADLARLPYAAEIPLEKMLAGRYLLKVTVIDRIARTSATQQLYFQVE